MFRALMAPCGLLILFSAIEVEAQQPSPDSLVELFISKGALSPWLPYELFSGCPDLEPWQETGFEMLSSKALSRRRLNDLALAWMFPLEGCSDSRLEEWYFRNIREAAGRGESTNLLLDFWQALAHADSPAIRDFLRGLMLDSGAPADIRGDAGATLFRRFGSLERRREYLDAFATGQLPAGVAGFQTVTLLREDSRAVLSDIGSLIRGNPALMEQPAFAQAISWTLRSADEGTRRALADDIEAALQGPGLEEDARGRLRASVKALRTREP